MSEDSPYSPKSIGQGLSTQPFHTLTELADPFHVDPIGRGLHDWVAGWADPAKKENGGFEGMVAQPGATHSGQPTTGSPTQQDGGAAAEEDMRRRVNNLRSASTILSGSGAGLLDEPNVYSAGRLLSGN